MSTRTPGDPGNDSNATPEQVLATPPVTDDITSALKPTRSRGGLPMMSYVLAAVILVGAGYLAGTIRGKDSSSTTPFGGGIPSGFPAGASGAGGRAGAGGGVTFGTVTKVDGNTVYVKQADGTIITVTTNGSTTVHVSKTGTVSDLSPGTTVIVQGSSSGQDSVTAQTITEGGGFAGPGTGTVPTPVGGSGS